jgi:hypothetical protein
MFIVAPFQKADESEQRDDSPSKTSERKRFSSLRPSTIDEALQPVDSGDGFRSPRSPIATPIETTLTRSRAVSNSAFS